MGYICSAFCYGFIKAKEWRYDGILKKMEWKFGILMISLVIGEILRILLLVKNDEYWHWHELHAFGIKEDTSEDQKSGEKNTTDAGEKNSEKEPPVEKTEVAV